MICINHDIGFKVISSCKGCASYKEGEIHKLNDLIPKGHCFELLHSLLPYMYTFKHGGWFKWERNKDRVIVCCPAVENNICVELRKKTESDSISFIYKILNIRGNCEFYNVNKTMEITKNDFGGLCWELFNIIYPYVRMRPSKINIKCTKKGFFELFS